MPAHVLRIPPAVLQTLPEKSRLADASNFMTARDAAFLRELRDEFTERVDQARRGFLEPLVVRAERTWCRSPWWHRHSCLCGLIRRQRRTGKNAGATGTARIRRWNVFASQIHRARRRRRYVVRHGI